MTTKAMFVGINRYQDPVIPEPSGARRDAMALRALFTDSIEGLAARCLAETLEDSNGSRAVRFARMAVVASWQTMDQHCDSSGRRRMRPLPRSTRSDGKRVITVSPTVR